MSMLESDPMYLTDYAADMGYFPCDLCGAYVSQEELQDIPWDAPGETVRCCLACREGIAWVS